MFASVDVERLAGLLPEGMVREDEGPSVVLRRADADAAGLAYDFVAAWLTLRVHSDLAASGLTAVVSEALADAGIPCNVIAGARHDHLLVPVDRADAALAILRGLARRRTDQSEVMGGTPNEDGGVEVLPRPGRSSASSSSVPRTPLV